MHLNNYPIRHDATPFVGNFFNINELKNEIQNTKVKVKTEDTREDSPPLYPLSSES